MLGNHSLNTGALVGRKAENVPGSLVQVFVIRVRVPILQWQAMTFARCRAVVRNKSSFREIVGSPVQNHLTDF